MRRLLALGLAGTVVPLISGCASYPDRPDRLVYSEVSCDTPGALRAEFTDMPPAPSEPPPKKGAASSEAPDAGQAKAAPRQRCLLATSIPSRAYAGGYGGGYYGGYSWSNYRSPYWPYYSYPFNSASFGMGFGFGGGGFNSGHFGGHRRGHR